MKAKGWVRVPSKPKPAEEAEKRRIVATCEAFIRDVLKPRFLPQIKPTEWNYPIDIFGVWAGGRYRFMQRFRSGHKDNLGEEFDDPFTRIVRVGPDSFDVDWMRHTGQWWRLYRGVTLAEAFKIIEKDGHLHPFE
jgi:hypothetical protein